LPSPSRSGHFFFLASANVISSGFFSGYFPYSRSHCLSFVPKILFWDRIPYMAQAHPLPLDFWTLAELSSIISPLFPKNPRLLFMRFPWYSFLDSGRAAPPLLSRPFVALLFPFSLSVLPSLPLEFLSSRAFFLSFLHAARTPFSARHPCALARLLLSPDTSQGDALPGGGSPASRRFPDVFIRFRYL